MRNKIKAAGVASLLLGVTMASAGALPGQGWYTTASIQNIDTTAGTVQLTAYGSATDSYSTASFSLAAGKSVNFFPNHGSRTSDISSGAVDTTTALPAGFSGSMVISADKKVAAIAQIGNNVTFSDVGTSGGYASGQYRGTSTPASLVQYPTFKANYAGKSSLVSIQAASTNVTYIATITTNNTTGTKTHTKTGTIAANRSILLGPSDFSTLPQVGCSDAANTSACLGSITVSATGGNIAGAVMEYKEGQSPATIIQATSMFAPTDAGSTVYCPSVKHRYTKSQLRTSGITVQNVGNSEATVNLAITIAASETPADIGTTKNTSLAIPAGQARTFFGPGLGIPEFSQGSAKLTSTGGAIVANVNEANNDNPNPLKAVTYSCFSQAAGTTKVAFPQFKHNFGGNQATTGASVQNIGNAATNITAAFSCQTGNFSATRSIAAGAVTTFFNPAEVPAASLCGVTVTSTAAPILGIAQESTDFTPSTNATHKLLDTKNYEGINLQ